MQTFQETLAACTERTLNAWLDTDPTAASRLVELDGLVIGIEITTFPLQLFFLPTAKHLRVLPHTDRQADTFIRGKLLDLVKLGTGRRQPDDDVRLTIEGDSAAAHAFQRLLASANLDWEELLALKIGDVAAHELARGIRAANRWAGHSFDSLNEAMGEYLAEETRLVAGNHEIDDFIRRVDRLRDRIETLEAHVKDTPGNTS